jgi:hypothetical protein
VARVRGPDATHPGAIVGAVQPADELRPDPTAQHPPTFQARTLAGDDQDDPKILRHGCIEKVGDGALGSGECHAVQVERCLRHKLAAPQGARGIAVEIPVVGF